MAPNKLQPKLAPANKHAAIELASREVMILILVIIIVAVVIGVIVGKLGVVQKTLELIAGQKNLITPAS